MTATRRTAFGRFAAALAFPVLLAGCSLTMGRLAVATTRPVPLEALAAPPAVRRHAAGEACTPIVVGFPVGPLPNVQTATERALTTAHASVLSDVVVRYRMWYVPLVGGRVCYVAEGDAW